MTKSNKIERIVYIAIMLSFVIAGFFKIIKLPNDSFTNYYFAVFQDKDSFNVYGNVFLGLPFLAAICSIGLNIAELIMGKIHYGVEHTNVTCYIIFFAAGVLFSYVSDNFIPYGVIILGTIFAVVVTRIIFHYGIRNMKI